jgi:hypothetical protein
MSLNDMPTGPSSPSPFRRTGFLFAAGFLLLVAIAAIAVVTMSGHHHHTTTAGPTSTARPAPGPAATPGTNPAATTAGCTLTDTDQTVPVTAPAGVTWTIYNTVALPQSAADGPAVVNGDVARCYSHTPTGALLAAAQISVRYLIADNWQAVLATQVVPGPGPSVYASERAQVTGSAVDSGSPGFGQYAAYQFAAYTPNQATIQLVTRFPAGTMQMVTTTVTWSGTDWQLQLQPTGGISPNAQALTTLTGFTPWAGV